MRYFYNVVILGFVLFSPLVLFGQSGDATDLDAVFGRRSRNPCIVERNAGFTKSCSFYKFNDEYSIGIEQDAASRILSVDLAPKGTTEDLESSITDKDKSGFLSMVSKARPLGGFRFSGRSQAPGTNRFDGWDVYENAIVMSVYDRLNGQLYELSNVKVLFPSSVTGLISEFAIISLGDGFGIPLVVIDGCSFLTTDKGLSQGSQGTFAVIGPRNNCVLRLSGAQLGNEKP